MTERVRLHETNEERDKYDGLADLYSIIVAIERVERAYFKSTMSPEDYSKQCKLLLNKYKALFKVLEGTIGGLNQFLAEYRLTCDNAVNRIKSGVPATEEGVSVAGASAGISAAKDVKDATETMITTLDALKMSQASADDLHPYLADVVQRVSKVFPNLPELGPIKEWLRLVNSFKASDELNPDQIRQCSFDIQLLYTAFDKKLDETK